MTPSAENHPEGNLPRYVANYNRTAFVFAAAYFLTCSIYIVASDRVVAALAQAPELAVRLQTLKGIGFVALSALLIFAMARRLLGRIAADQVRLREQQHALVEAERRATASLVAHAVAHDMNNVLTVGMANVELLRSHAHLDADGVEMLNDIAQSFDRLHDMTCRMSIAGQSPRRASAAQEADLMALVRREAHLARRHRLADRCEILVQGPERLVCPLHASLMQDLLQNLLFNAVEAMNGEGRVEVRVSEGPRDYIIEVHDSGPGVPADRRTQIFEPLYTTKPTGMGLGLTSVKAAAKAHEGRIEVTDSPLGGACFRVVIPKKSAS